MARENRTTVKSVENATLFSDGTILLKNVRASYPHVVTQGKFDGKDSGYSIQAMMPKKSHAKAIALVNEQIEKTKTEAKVKVAADKIAFKDGDNSDKDAYDGCMVLSARETKRPALRDARNERIDVDKADGIFYGGCWVNVLVRPWAQNNSWGKRINFNLLAVQKVRDDEAFGEGRITEDEIDDTFADETEDLDV